ncbi:HD domain-containing protein [Verrucosispora sp. TAA-831]|uniref:HD domain-containing protein n=1 Tax=Verrucosispora sp. TAA-831 TaxID=3422227 RepID=UPI003D6DF891
MSGPTVADADRLAAAAHLGQLDKAGQPYIAHPRAVAAMLAEQGHGDHVLMAALLHDVVEDTAVTLDDLRAASYPAEVVDAVDAVTKREGETYMDAVWRAAAHPLGLLVKLADNAHNSLPDRLALLPDADADRLRRKYVRARRVLLAAEDAW